MPLATTLVIGIFSVIVLGLPTLLIGMAAYTSARLPVGARQGKAAPSLRPRSPEALA